MSTTKALTLSGFHATIRVTKLMEKVARQVYSVESRKLLKSDPSAAELIRIALWQELKDYYASINRSSDAGDAVLSRETAVPPALVTNSVWMWTTVILLHNPFTAPQRKQTALENTATVSDSDPLEVTFAAAEKICQILETHTKSLQRFPCDLIFPIFTAANALSNSRHVGPGVREKTLIQSKLGMCFKWLSIICSNWKYAGKSRSKLTQDLDMVSRHVSPLPGGVESAQSGSSSTSALAHAEVQYISPTPTQHSYLPADSAETINQSDPMVSNTDWESPIISPRPDMDFAPLDADFRDFLDNGLWFTLEEFSSV